MSIALRKPADPRALVEASQAIRGLLGVASHPPAPTATRRSRYCPPSPQTPEAMRGLNWPASDVRKLEEMCGKVAVEIIAVAVGRSVSAVKSKANNIGLHTRIYSTKRRFTPISPERSRLIFSQCYPSMQKIIRAVSVETGVSINELLSRRRTRPLATARRTMIWTLARDTKLSLSRIGARLQMDHTSVRFAVVKEDAKRGTSVQSMRSRFNAGRPL